MRWLVLLALASCYSPSIAPCRLACAGTSCPDGLACNAQGMCAESEAAVCSMGPDGGDDAGACTFPAISNVDPCALGVTEAGAVEVTSPSGMATIDTDSLGASGITGLVLTMQQQFESPNPVTVAVASSWTHRAGTVLVITGERPLIIVANDFVQINGDIRWVPSFDEGGCPTRGMAGTDVATTAGGGGGGGGGYGASISGDAGQNGGAGGNYGSFVGGDGGIGGGATMPVTAPLIRPLRGGCPGGDGGSAGAVAVAGGKGGNGGGALQISARTKIRAGGVISVPGGGGAGGSPATATARSGAGGGGAGGAILLEAPTIDLMNASLCANGGAGGGTGPGSMAGMNGTCTNTPATGGAGSGANDGKGGNGATGSTAATTGSNGAPVAMNPQPPSHGGGGGGGSVGRIRVNGTIMHGASTASPVYTEGPL